MEENPPEKNIAEADAKAGTVEKAPPQPGKSRQSGEVDLSALKGLTIGPKWRDSGTDAKTGGSAKRESGSGFLKGAASLRRDRKSGGMHPSRRMGGGERREHHYRQGERGKGFGRSRGEDRTFWKPTVEVHFYPADAVFKALMRAMRASCRTFELFALAHLLLEKPERFVVSVKPLPEKADQDNLIIVSVPDDLPFETEEEAINHVLKHHFEEFFHLEEVEGDAPSGNFSVINRCSITGELIGPPNYHRYQQLEEEHYRNHLSHLSMEKFKSGIEQVREPEVVEEWLRKMTRQTRYALKSFEETGGEEISFDNFESARHYLMTHLKKRVLKSAWSARFPGKAIEQLPPEGEIRRSIERVLEAERRFPLKTANHLRGRLRQLKFAFFKKGSKGISYVCAVRRKIRFEGELFSESVQQLIDFLEKNPYLPALELPWKMLGLKRGEEGEMETAMSPPNQSALNRIALDLRWLVSEGYVVEYDDGRLFIPPPRHGSDREKSGGKREVKKEIEGESESGSGSESEGEGKREGSDLSPRSG